MLCGVGTPERPNAGFPAPDTFPRAWSLCFRTQASHPLRVSAFLSDGFDSLPVSDRPRKEPNTEEVGTLRLAEEQRHRHREHSGGAGEKVGLRRKGGFLPGLTSPHSVAPSARDTQSGRNVGNSPLFSKGGGLLLGFFDVLCVAVL